MKKALVLLILSISLAICLTACDWQLAFGWIIDCDEPIDHTHKFGKWSVTERPTSTKEGLQERICSCGERESKTIAKLPAGYSVGLDYKLNEDGQSYSVSGIGDCKDRVLVITPVYDGLPVTGIYRITPVRRENFSSVVIPDSVTSISDYAFYGCESLTDIVIPDSVTSIGDRAFWDCTSLTSIVIPDSVTSIGGFAFIGCTGLTDVYITDIDAWCNISFRSYYSNPMYYGANLYLDGNLVTELIIPDGVTSIGDHAFDGCTSLTSIMIPDSVTSIGDMVFYGCTGLTSITVDEDNMSYQSIDGNLYSKNGRTLIQYAIGKKNTSFTIPDRVKSIGAWAFRDCTDLTSIVIPDSVTSIGDMAFYGCTGLTSIVIPDSVTWINSWTFSHCTGLTSIVIGDGVKSIGGWSAFSGCTSLTSIVIPDSVTGIGYRAFEGCINLKDVYYTGIKQKWEKISINDDNEYLTNATIHYNYVPAN